MVQTNVGEEGFARDGWKDELWSLETVSDIDHGAQIGTHAQIHKKQNTTTIETSSAHFCTLSFASLQLFATTFVSTG